MIKRKGDLFTTDAFYLGHGVNCRGKMGAGIAKTFKEKFPVNYDSYAKACQSMRLNPGEVFSIYENHRVILNMATQLEPGKDARYDAVFNSALVAAKKVADPNSYWKNMKRVIAIPEIGCGIGGLEWDKVERLISAVEVLVPEVVWEVWKYEG